MADRSHPYRRIRTQYSLEILHVPPGYPLDELESDLKHRWGYCIDSFRTIKNEQQPTYIFYVNFSTEDDALDCVDYLKDNRLTPGMHIRERKRDVNLTDKENVPMGGAREAGRERRPRGRGRGRTRGRGFNAMVREDEFYTPDYDLGRPEPPKVDNINLPPLPARQEYNSHNPYPSRQQETSPYPPIKEFNKPFLPAQEPTTPPGQERNPLTRLENRPNLKKEKNENIIHVGNIPSFVDKDILSDVLLGKQIEGVLDIKIREDPSDSSVNEARIYVSDASAMEGIISKLNHVKVASKPLSAKQYKKESPRKEIDPKDYISSERVDGAKQFMSPPPPSQSVKSLPRKESQSEEIVEKSIDMSIQLYDFVKKKFRPQIEAFNADNGEIQHEAETLTLKSANPGGLKTLYSSITSEVSEQKQTFSEDDYHFLDAKNSNQHNLVEEKAHLFMTAGQIGYYLDSSAFTLRVFGIKNCVDVVVTNIQDALYYQYVLKCPMDIYVSVFPGIIPETIGNAGILRDSKVLISSKIGIQECKYIRGELKKIHNSLVCEPCSTFQYELITSGLKYCKEKNLRVAIIFRDSEGLLFKKYKPETVVTLCGSNVQVLAAKQVFCKPICCELAATKDGLILINQTIGRNQPLNKCLEQEFAISIQLCKSSVKLQGFLQNDLDKACERIKGKMDSVEVFLSQVLKSYQIEFFLEAARNEVHWTMDMLSEFELNYGVELIKTKKRDFCIKGNQEAFQKIESEKHQISAIFKDIILLPCDKIGIDKTSCEIMYKLLESFIEHHLENEDIYVCYGWNIKDSRGKANQLEMHIELVGTKDQVNIISLKIQAIKPENGKLRDKYLPNEVQQIDQFGSILKNIEATEFIRFCLINQRIEYYSLGVSSKKPWEIFDDIMSDQMVVRSIPLKYETLYFLRSKKLLENCGTEFSCSIVEEHQERRAGRQGVRRRSDQYDNVKALTVKGKNADVKAAIDKLKKFIANFTCKSIDLRFGTKMLQTFLGAELESLKKDLESKELLILDIREAKNKIWGKGAVESEDEISFSVRVEALDEDSCIAFVNSIQGKLRIVESEEFNLTDRQLSILMSALKDKKIPRNEHYNVVVEFKARRTGSAKIIALKHFEDAIEKGIYATSPYLQFKDQMYTPPKFILEILFHHQKYGTCMNINAKTLGIEHSRPHNIRGSYKFSGNRSSIQKMIFNLKTFEIGFVRLCDKMEIEVNLPLDELKKDSKYNTLENDLAKNCNVKIFSFGSLPIDIENEVKKATGDFQYFSDDTAFFEQDDSENNTLGSYTFGNVTIQVIKGDITKLTVDCIINGANLDLDHSLGLAKAISDAGGPSIQKGCNNYIQKEGKLDVGGAVLQGGGNLPCTKIIHVSCPSWDQFDQKKCTSDLSMCIQTAFSLCDTHKLSSIAIPGLSTGIFGFPMGISTNTIVRECKRYIQGNMSSCFQRVLLIDCNAPIVKSFNKDCQRAFGLNPRSRLLSEELDSSESIYGNTLGNLTQDIPLLDSTPPIVEFLWQEDDLKYYPYDAKYQNLLQRAYEISPQGKATFKRGEYTYTVHFKSLEQVNDSTQARRKIKINTQANPDTIIPIPKPRHYSVPDDLDSDNSGIDLLWYFLNEFNTWVPYQKDVAKQLSDAYLNNPKGNVSVEMNGYTYIIDFNTMTQRNQSTNTSRNVKVDKKRLEAAMDVLATTSGEKVILYGLKENLLRAKGKFDNFIQSKVFHKQFDVHGLPKTVMIPTIMKLKKKYSYLKIEIKDKGEEYCIKLNGFEREVRTVHDELKDHYIQFLEQVTQQEQASGFSFPKEWQQHNANQMICLVPLVNGCPEWTKVANHFNKTSPRKIAQIDRIQNKWLWRKYQQTKDSFKELNQNPNELTVFHGTRNTDPSLIYQGTEGFDFRHSSKGMWGKANYFANNASFCESYQYVDPTTGLNNIFMVKLLAGNVSHLRSDSSLTMPPLLPSGNSNFVGQRYDTVSGDHDAGSKIYMLYTNERTYPEYLVTYS